MNKMLEDLRIRIEQPVWSHYYDVYIFGTGTNTKLLCESVDKGGAVLKTLSIQENVAREIMNDLWRIGIRPADKLTTAPVDAHVKDLQQSIEFHQSFSEKLLNKIKR